MYLVLSYFIRHNLSIEAVTDLLKMLNVIFGSRCLPETYYGFSNAFKFNEYVKHFCCSVCHYYFEDIEETSACPCCAGEKKVYFITLPIKNQLQAVIQKYQDEINTVKSKRSTGILSDIHTGRILKDDDEHMLSISFSVDGVSTANSNAKKSMWPIVSVINDLPIEQRFARKNMIVSGIWLSEKSPPMAVFLKAFTQELNHLFSAGLKINGITFKFRVAAVIADVPGKSKILNSTQFNGRFGCSYCYHPGTKISNNQIRYSHKNSIFFEDRTHDEQIFAMVEAHTTGTPVQGLKGLSPVVALNNFDVVKQIPIDYMHNCLLGVTKTLLTLWTDSKYHKKKWYLGNIRRKTVLNTRYSNICGFNEVSRAPRNVFEIAKLKANELQDWLLYYSIGYLAGILPEKYLNHFSLFRAAITKLLSNTNRNEDLIGIKEKLVQFVTEFEKLYGVKFMTINIHLLLHLSAQISNFGPLWTVSMFCFEDFYGYLKGLIKGPNGPIIQIVRKYSLMKSCHFSFNTQLSPKAIQYYSNIFKTSRSAQYTNKKKIEICHNGLTSKCYSLKHIYIRGIQYKCVTHNTKKKRRLCDIIFC
uniref:Putative enspm-5 stu n=1 Tax=Aedes albopictus TaxID=7160 RepID=A0A1W7R5X7_AEDAL